MRVLRNEFVEEMSPRMWKRLSSYVSLLNALLVWVVSTFFFSFFLCPPRRKKKSQGGKSDEQKSLILAVIYFIECNFKVKIKTASETRLSAVH